MTWVFGGTALPNGAVNVFGLQQNPLITDPAEVAGILHNAWGTFISSVIASDVTLEETRVKFGPNEDGPFASAGTPKAGVLTGTSGPPSVAILVKKNTALGGKSGSGRWYAPGLSEELVSRTGHLDVAHLGNLNDAYGGFLESINSSAGPMFLLHSHGTRPDGTTVPLRAPTEVNSLTVDPVAATQRQRMRR